MGRRHVARVRTKEDDNRGTISAIPPAATQVVCSVSRLHADICGKIVAVATAAAESTQVSAAYIRIILVDRIIQ